jgi:hypothetical protein
MRSPIARSRHEHKGNSKRFAAALLAALAIFVAVPNATLDAAPQHHDQQPGFYRLKVGDLEVTALYDGTGVFDPHWLNGTKATMDGVVKALQEDPHMLDVVDGGFLVNTGKKLILVDAGAGTWWGGGALGRLEGSLRSAGYTPEGVDIVLLTHLHSDHFGGLTTQEGNRVFPNADVYVAKAESDRTSRPVNGTRLMAPSQSSTACKSSRFLVTLRDIRAMNFRQRDKKFCFGATSSMPSESNCNIPRSPRFSTSTRLRLRRRGINCYLSSRARMF